MRAVVQRVSRARVTVGDDTVGEIAGGLAVLVGVGHEDGEAEARALADKLVGLRVFPDGEGRMNLSVADTGGSVLLISQFTLLADLRKGRRPSFVAAADPEAAKPLIDALAAMIEAHGILTATGRFGASMAVELVNDGPVTLVVDVSGGRVV